MKYNFDLIVNRYKTNSLKYDCKENILPMWVADMDFQVLPEIKQAIIKKAEINAYGYVQPGEEYYNSYIEWFKSQHNLNIKKEWLIHSSGCVASLDSILKRFTKYGEGVALFSPNYNVFFNCIKNNGLFLEECLLKYENYSYSIDWIDLENRLKNEKTKILILCNPHNPIGKLFSEDELFKIVKLATDNSVIVISDEIHCDITDPGKKYVPILNACEQYKDNIICLLSATKAFNLAGIQASVIVCPNKEYFDIIDKGICSDDLGDPNYFACDAVTAAFKYGKEWNKEVSEYIYSNKCYIKNFLEKELPNLHLIEGGGTYLLWVDISHYSFNSIEFCKDLKEKTGLWLSPGSNFGSNGNNFVRINIATSISNIKSCCERLKKYLA